MHHNAHQIVQDPPLPLTPTRLLRHQTSRTGRARPIDALIHIGRHVQLARKLKVVVELERAVRLPVVVEALQLNAQVLGQLLDARALYSRPLLIALLTVVRVLPVQQLVLHELEHALLQVARLDWQIQAQELLLALVAVRAVLADELVGEGALEEALEDGLLVDLLQVLVDLVRHGNEEVEGVLLLADVDLSHIITIRIS